ncbi:hypothetical protein KBY83_09905 [Cyanobium sp. WKJ7-Wakatipu]|uniref:hypothetical protein n=1 Tax=Cyanobium sp. WKJ7-Wakatipu TaxID=2823726 RepID=UPI0020CE464E|nr:hypothetical protein [Cyanobium sp. WKJ7-Wakatipu]MCP9783625.1 hypothetical protein [Cyanobium sp. WKJ7-Wakatipu]
MHKFSARAFTGIFIILMQSHAANANEFRLPSRISCINGSVAIKQISPAQTYENTTTAGFTLTVGGVTEQATGIANGNYNKIESRGYYVFLGTGGLTFAKQDGINKAICTNSKYGNTTKGFMTE